MQLAYGFVSICLSEHRCSPAGNVTVKRVESVDDETKRSIIKRVALEDLNNTMRIMWFLKAHDIELYRMSANLIPLATHPVTDGWRWWDDQDLKEIGAKIGRVARQQGYRLSSHLPEVCGFASDASFRWTTTYLQYHRRLFDMLGLDAGTKIIIHVGGFRGDKLRALKVARRHLEELPEWGRQRVVLENGDTGFDLADVVQLAEEFSLPVAFDFHHHWINHQGDVAGPEAVDLVSRAFRLWTDRPPKVHLSSPLSESKPRAHADYVDASFLKPFWDMVTQIAPKRLDVMVEAKKKDLALLRLREEVI